MHKTFHILNCFLPLFCSPLNYLIFFYQLILFQIGSLQLSFPLTPFLLALLPSPYCISMSLFFSARWKFFLLFFPPPNNTAQQFVWTNFWISIISQMCDISFKQLSFHRPFKQLRNNLYELGGIKLWHITPPCMQRLMSVNTWLIAIIKVNGTVSTGHEAAQIECV